MSICFFRVYFVRIRVRIFSYITTEQALLWVLLKFNFVDDFISEFLDICRSWQNTHVTSSSYTIRIFNVFLRVL